MNMEHGLPVVRFTAGTLDASREKLISGQDFIAAYHPLLGIIQRHYPHQDDKRKLHDALKMHFERIASRTDFWRCTGVYVEYDIIIRRRMFKERFNPATWQ